MEPCMWLPDQFTFCWCIQWTHSDVWSQLATTLRCSCTIGYRQREKKRRNRDWRAIFNATRRIGAGHGLVCHRGVSDGSDGAIPPGRKCFLLMKYDIYVKDVVLHAHSLHFLHFAFRPLFFDSLRTTSIVRRNFTETQQVLIWTQIGEREEKAHAKLRVLRIYHSVIRSELKYLIGANVLSLPQRGSAVCITWPNNCGFRRGCGLEPVINWGFDSLPDPDRDGGHGSGRNPYRRQVTCNCS